MLLLAMLELGVLAGVVHVCVSGVSCFVEDHKGKRKEDSRETLDKVEVEGEPGLE